MDKPFSFVPRKISRKISKPPPPTASQSPAPKAEFSLTNTREYQDRRLKGSATTSVINERPKVVYSEEDYKIMLSLSLSQFALFRDPGLRRLVHQSTRDGFFPLNVLFTHPCILKYAHEPEMAVVKALRSQGTDLVDVRMNLAESKARGNFEVKPKFWEEGDDACAFTRDDWERRTVYVENIPVAHRTFPSAVRFVSALLPPGPSIYTRIQGISIPPHHAENEDTEPTPKPFALITFSDIDDAETLVKAWPWQRDLSRVEESLNAAEAVKFGFRTLSKRRWDELNAEYIVYRASLLQTTDSQTTESDAVIEPTKPIQPQKAIPPRVVSASAPALAAPAWYPQNCLVFLWNIHPDTNKTTLRKLFLTAVESKDALDYVDFNKNMDSCYLRVINPDHARTLVEHFTAKRTVQTTGLDELGSSEADGKAIVAELVQGTREEIYWEKVPEKVRLAAVQRANGQSSGPVTDTGERREDGGRQRKKQKR